MFFKKTIFGACALMFALSLFSAIPVKAQEALNFGVIPLENQEIMFQKFIPLTKYLSQELGVEVNLVIGKNYLDTMDAIGKNKIQIAYLTPTTYPKSARLHGTAGIEPLVRFQKKGSGTYRSCIIAPIDSSIETIADLKGQKFAFGNKNSTSSHLMPRSILAGAGVQFEDIKAEYLGTHSNVAAAVSVEQFSGGGVKESVANKFAEDEEVKIIAISDPIPQFPICVNKHVTSDLKTRIIAAFDKLNDGTTNSKAVMQAINKGFTGVEKTASGDYDVIRTMIDNLYGDSFYER